MFVNDALDLEVQQWVPSQKMSMQSSSYNAFRLHLKTLKETVSRTGDALDDEKAEQLSERLEGRFQSLYDRLHELAPLLADAEVGSLALPDIVRIPLLSTFSTNERERFGLDGLARIETRLRLRMCFDCLKKLKDALGVRSFLTRHSKTQHGVHKSTRAQEAIQQAEGVVRKWGKAYRRSWGALDLMAVPVPERLGLQELVAADLTILGDWLEGEQYKYGAKKLPWIWILAPVPGLNADEGGQHSANQAVEAWNEEG